MRLSALRFALASSLVLAYVTSSAGASAESQNPRSLRLLTRDGDEHGHHHGVGPLLELNETEVTLYHQPTPPSYYTIDWEDPEQADARHPGLIITHSVFMFLAFLHLPANGHHDALSKKSLARSHGISLLRLTPNMYEGSTHAPHGYRILVVALALTFIDTLGALRRLASFLFSGKQYTCKGIARALLGREEVSGPEYIELMVEEPEAIKEEDRRHSYDDVPESDSHRPTKDFSHGDTEQWANHVRMHSTMSDGTLFGFGPSSPHSEETLHGHLDFPPQISLIRRIGRAVFAATERALVIAGFGLLLTGIVIYTGGCRQNYINGCLAHLIKGGIFWVYGIISFARFLGWCSELGWSWNRAPSSKYPTAEMVESTVIFLYGATNTWMERFGANPGDPFTTKEIQHIGIAVMFWFAGLMGMAMESKTIRKWLAALAVDTSENISEPETYTSSFNPFPALVIGVTGSVMAAHFQTYLFQVQIHALWGNLLLAFAVLRCLTYFFLWVAPPRSTLPSRPPTEALASFFLACGGLSFIFSTEEVTIMAMRRGRDDIMMFAVTAVAITCLAFCWTTFVVGFHGWMKTRTKRVISYNNSA
ncbi:hypothetical protein MSAN_01435000 [Mycena sanguinolenta]|uniref:Protein YTP1-like C-terminal domain-containing protein n=1 Tax=Mycena sanguinolenta TaxID=230812 RepID=A0A8H6Y8I5_9AGAR|nr:hypothetical protein MSAN_01435000 [Mycena sanguinolenta]